MSDLPLFPKGGKMECPKCLADMEYADYLPVGSADNLQGPHDMMRWDCGCGYWCDTHTADWRPR